MSHEPVREGGWVGRPVPLKEDARLVAGRGHFVDDLGRPRMLHAAMLRSPHAHARIVAVDTREAEALPGVFGILTGAEAAMRSGSSVSSPGSSSSVAAASPPTTSPST